MKQKNEIPEPASSVHPLDVMRQAFRSMEICYEDEDGSILSQLTLENLDVQVSCCGEPDDIATVTLLLPVHAEPKACAAAGEFLHRLNFDVKRKFWEFDYNSGEIRLAGYTDTLVGPLTEPLFRELLEALAFTADNAFPSLTSVLAGRMSPESAAAQAEAALDAAWKK